MLNRSELPFNNFSELATQTQARAQPYSSDEQEPPNYWAEHRAMNVVFASWSQHVYRNNKRRSRKIARRRRWYLRSVPRAGGHIIYVSLRLKDLVIRDRTELN